VHNNCDIHVFIGRCSLLAQVLLLTE
jgi:hypothetical protein